MTLWSMVLSQDARTCRSGGKRKVQSLTGWEGEDNKPRSQTSDSNVVACINSQVRSEVSGDKLNTQRHHRFKFTGVRFAYAVAGLRDVL